MLKLALFRLRILTIKDIERMQL